MSPVWTFSLRDLFQHLLDIPPHLAADLEAFVPDFLHRLVQLAEMPFDKITGTPTGILALRLLKAEQMEALLDDAVWDRGLLMRVSRDALELFLRYILGAGIDKEAFARTIEALDQPEAKAVAMTLADQFRQEGQQQALAQAVLKTLGVRFGRVPEGLKEAVQETVAEKLDALLQAALQAASLEEFAAAM